jgi:hypothetical protein
MEGSADVVILEGIDHIEKDHVARAAGMVMSGQAHRMVVVLTRRAPADVPSDPDVRLVVIRSAMNGSRLEEKQYRIIETGLQHPVTLTSAKEAMEILAGEGIRSAILVSPGFHTRRSYLVYQSIGEPYQIRIHPHASFDGHDHGLERWWAQYEGARDFVEQVLKLAYYLVRGYIPLKLSYGN